MPSLRIVSLLPSATEIVCALGATADLVGVSHECDYPDEIRDRVVLTRSRIASDGSSLAIDTLVRGVVRDALSIYSVDEARLAALAPDVIVTQDLCEVCAVSLDDVRSAVARLAHCERVTIVSLRPTRFADVLDDVDRVAVALGREAQGRTVHAELEKRTDAIRSRARSARTRPRVASIEWIEPLMLGGTWMPELIEMAGGEPVGVEAGRPAPTISPAELTALRPDVVLVKPCGFTLPRTLGERDAIDRMIRSQIPASVRVFATDGNAYFNRPGPRLLESLEIMAACVQPAAFADFAAKHAAVIAEIARV